MMKHVHRSAQVLAAVLVSGLLLALNADAQRTRAERPNIIFIMTDDMGIGDTTVYNPESKIPTPNMDAIAAEGMTFTDAHSPAAICTPTRYAFLTGRYTWRSRLKGGVFGGYNYPLVEEGRETVGSILQASGYGTAVIGKWHIGLDWGVKDGLDHPPYTRDYDQDDIDFAKPLINGPNQIGFDYSLITAGCTTDDPPLCYIENGLSVGIPNVISRPDTAFEGREMLMVPGWKHEETDVDFTNQAIEFMENHVKTRPDDPFFIYLPLSVPHVPWLPPEFVKGMSQAGPRGDQVVLADWIIGHISVALERLDLTQDTILIFTSDNGPRKGMNGHKSAGNWRGMKGSIYEGGHRVPFIVRWPGVIEAGSVSDEMMTFTDMMATFAAIAGVELPDGAGEDSFNMLPVWLGEKLDGPVRETMLNDSGHERMAIRRGPWKYIPESEGRGRNRRLDAEAEGELYNLADDPGETTNLYDDRADVAHELMAILQKQIDQGYSRPM